LGISSTLGGGGGRDRILGKICENFRRKTHLFKKHCIRNFRQKGSG